MSLIGSNSSKRRRRVTVHHVSCVCPGAGTAAASPWASMNEELVRLIAWRVLAGDLLDYVRFRAVCRHWRSTTVCPRGCGVIDPRFHPRRWMMFPEGHGLHPSHTRPRDYIRFLNLDTGRFVRAKLPVFKDHCVLDSVDGLLVMHRDEDTAIRILHPFTGDVVDLPRLATLAPHIDLGLPGAFLPAQSCYYLRGVCASVSVSAAGAVAVLLALHRMGRVAFATSRDQQWHMSTWTFSYITPLSFQGKLYMARMSFDPKEDSDIFQVDPPPPPPPPQDHHHVDVTLPPPKLIATIPTDKLTRPIHLVECDSQTLVTGYTDRSWSHMIIHRLADLITLENPIPVTSIGDKALFLNNVRSMSVSSNGALPTVVGNTIVQASLANGSLTEYNLSTDAWSRPMDGCILRGPVFGPCCLIYHIYTCCIREYWNKGQLCNRNKPCNWRVKGKWRTGV
ncbi:hypothetical protein CFC21_055696 [Triticum aestivum]|uniref:KIB1-4 beta-propeller domain-containing protein n=2 Tax=Triticum aestivum TaxID=4565 RepID=A0A9R1GHE7_WHEAT|nr:hypothetical protein CFC21_055696 [Triticum aestivum]